MIIGRDRGTEIVSDMTDGAYAYFNLHGLWIGKGAIRGGGGFCV